jgi:hypothetical protein
MVTNPLPVKWYGPYSFVEREEENVFTSLMSEKDTVKLPEPFPWFTIYVYSN